MKMWPENWECPQRILLEGSGSSESLSLKPHSWSHPHPYVVSDKISIPISKNVFTNQTLYDLKSFSVWLLLLNGPKSFFVLGRANLAIHREAISL